MSTGGVRRRRTAAGLLLGIAVAGLACSPVASASPGQIVDMAEQCREQYPRDAQFLPAEAYLAAPRDAFSWRCKRVSISPKGGIVGDLAVDPNAYCSRINADLPSSASPTHPTGNAPAEPRASFGASTRSGPPASFLGELEVHPVGHAE